MNYSCIGKPCWKTYDFNKRLRAMIAQELKAGIDNPLFSRTIPGVQRIV
ncbi:MAG: hypothetical protein JETT_3957 [Candidatus Jettenia ecosi]|uniref:Uncharacterized protein n=1 Tax=Candidatus Jettenia ecosi TaxID=2494326 RepID=A0A533Q5H0_9BACT|nr:MAG: hypothetical protein JETT_3957 [Candidatus Jettenia ecosi]